MIHEKLGFKIETSSSVKMIHSFSMKIFKKQTERVSARLANRLIHRYLEDPRVIADDTRLRFLPGPSVSTDENKLPNTLHAIREVAG